MVKAIRPIPPAVRDAQARASDPKASTFVSANAGSGKTHVLVQRVIRLLLSGVPPEKILCITFTKAAAANMAERVFTTLGHWVTLDDAGLDAAIREAGIAHPDSKLRKEARKLFACALETPGGLKVQTIHALCTRLLQQFPFEANVPARFAVLDDRDQNEMMERANLAVFLEASRIPDSPIGRALRTAMANAADVTFKEVVREACLSRDHFMAWTDAAGNAAAAAAQMSAALGVSADIRIEDVEREIVDGPNLPRSSWKEMATLLDTSSKADQKQAERLRAALTFTGAAQVDEYLGVFLTDDRAPRASVVTNNFIKKNSAAGHRFEAEIDRLGPLIERRRAVVARDRTEALIHIATAAAAHYRREKLERGLLDYDDLIDKTLAMLDRVSSGWVHYKLDRGVDHVLIDEAQDTSPRQWDIVAHIISEFTSGAGARDGLVRTVFAVGDEKQSIFSFQGAAPREFDLRRRELKRRFEEAGLKFDPVSFTYSFRSGPVILHSVDHVFREQDIFRSIHAVENGYPIHNAMTDAGPSLIELWDLAVADDRQDIEGWRAPFDGVSVTSPEVKLARRIQAEIKRLVASGTMTGSAGGRRPLSYGDMLILVRRRGNAFDAVIQALKHAGIPVAGADRLKLTEHIAIIDLMNLADELLLPQDDLALAVALKSPLFGLDDDDLFKLAYQRRGSLREALAAQAPTDERFAAALRRLEQCERRFTQETPFAFYAWLLGGDGGRARILRRLGHEANDALDEFLELALSYERKAPASLQGFVAWLRAADTEVKRDMEISRDEVRVMTVHGAKGLEASVVFLVDTTTSPSDTQRLRLIHLPQGNAAPNAPGVVVWAGKKAEDPPNVADARKAMLGDTEDEYRRLLYVAMTRAADRLIVGGCMPGNMNTVRKSSWYDLITRGLANSGLKLEELETPAGKVMRYSRPDDVADLTGATASAAAVPIALPSWLRAPAAPEASAAGMLRPSDPADGDSHPIRTGESVLLRARALQRGTLVHRLLQSLPDVALERRRAAALGFLARNADGWSEQEQAALADQVLALIADPRFAAVFAPGSRAEVSIVGRLERSGQPKALVSGQIDRLVVTPDHVLIVDFKTNHAPPRTAAEAPQGYVRQLALYRAVLARLYPQLPVRAALLWTETTEIMEISASALDAALA
ncbi:MULTISPECIES: double-strand break repair helicase AddA [Bradyrhizobium]|jgi:ATP-dependent helicase/nuclease subunit A|uniref:double-strand break repair helicase AddA n=1 Tax=Bradyrhizobium TaxID=374 RepID=UPI0004872999|nr:MULTISPECIES: double-strand break repair helicase AddA [Bradyrhizobium]MCS3445112.1 ATP-dependent helicase/nuclease subunit A [Bradyrhizobium elkanii]MCS3563757.1 ATP-dependent helicase/nuclease subunit A [Bradyrhizobium elkanii]MCW2146408.1 ATP-dependent helicase/nuclease subunit A [Bradyrhizobium elkanii]MCW2354519.1 ATP-dependent helicase/nuclease subunit A [Bradyrhizobium elkanii]MCW2379238.1 ATP-dependent helicase/nuclease subunit A [Bradyrhizobium elkanii]